MDFPAIKIVVRNIADTLRYWSDTYNIPFTPSVNVTGGEPFLRKDIFQILEEISLQGFQIYLLTNGVLINGEIGKKLSAIGVKDVQVSLEGPEEIHEMIRGKGNFSLALKGVETLINGGITVTLNLTLSTLNAHYFKDMVALASSVGVQRLGFSRLVPYGRGALLLDRMVTKEDLKELYETILSLKVAGLEIVTGDPIASQIGKEIVEEDEVSTPTGGCAAGVSGLTLLPDGTITPCRRLNIPIGNVVKNSIREIWATSSVLGALRDKKQYKGRCGTCKRWAHCRGCRAIAYAYSQSNGRGDFLADDPQCFFL